MTQEEYMIKRVLELELENKELKRENRELKASKTVKFIFEDITSPKHIYKVEFEKGNVKVLKENEDE